MSAKKGLTMKNSYRNIFFSKLQYLSGKKRYLKTRGMNINFLNLFFEHENVFMFVRIFVLVCLLKFVIFKMLKEITGST